MIRKSRRDPPLQVLDCTAELIVQGLRRKRSCNLHPSGVARAWPTVEAPMVISEQSDICRFDIVVEGGTNSSWNDIMPRPTVCLAEPGRPGGRTPAC